MSKVNDAKEQFLPFLSRSAQSRLRHDFCFSSLSSKSSFDVFDSEVIEKLTKPPSLPESRLDAFFHHSTLFLSLPFLPPLFQSIFLGRPTGYTDVLIHSFQTLLLPLSPFRLFFLSSLPSSLFLPSQSSFTPRISFTFNQFEYQRFPGSL